MSTKKISLKVSDATEMGAYVSMPEGKGPFPGVIVFQEAFGVNQHMRNVCDRIAQEGYVAIAPALFHRSAGDSEFGYGDFSVVMPHFQAITPEGLAADVTACYDWLKKQPEVMHDKLGTIGFCLGGRVSFIANTILPFAACVSYYGGGLQALADKAADTKAPHLFFWGGLDKHILPEHVDTIVSAMNKAEKPFINVVFSYADHAFSCDDRPNYNADAAKEAWAMAMAFFKNKFGK
jgi:carboxymethylenebutenolidase